jgi:hypothetical protein
MAYRAAGLRALFFALVLPVVPGTLASPAAAAELVMVQQPGCTWCARWNSEIAPIWPKTEAGAFAPLRRAQLRDMPAGYALDRRVSFTPTFLVVDDDGEELGRLEGYPGADFFWPMIERLLADTAGFDLDTGK